MSSLVTKINDLAIRSANEFHNLRANELGNSLLTSLNTTSKTSLVSAINEVFGLVGAIHLTDIIDDGSITTVKTWSSSKINTKMSADIGTALSTAESYTDTAISNLINGAPTALDTLKELADAIANDDSEIAALVIAVDNRVSYSAQTKLTSEKLQARTNIAAIAASDVMPIVLASTIPDTMVSTTPSSYAAIFPSSPSSAFQSDVNYNLNDFIVQVGTRSAIASADFVSSFNANL